MNWQDKVAVVTGAGRTLCSEIAYDVLLRAEDIERNEIDISQWGGQGDTISEIIDRGEYF